MRKDYWFNEGDGGEEERRWIVVRYGEIMERMFKKRFVGLRCVVGIR